MDKYAAAELIRRIPGSGTVAVDEPMSRHTSFRIGDLRMYSSDLRPSKAQLTF